MKKIKQWDWYMHKDIEVKVPEIYTWKISNV